MLYISSDFYSTANFNAEFLYNQQALKGSKVGYQENYKILNFSCFLKFQFYDSRHRVELRNFCSCKINIPQKI